MKKRKLLVSLVVAACAVLSIGVHRLFDDPPSPGPVIPSAAKATSATAANRDSRRPGAEAVAIDPLALFTARVPFAGTAGVAGADGRAGALASDSSPAGETRSGDRGVGAGADVGSRGDDPGDDAWRVAGAMREGRVHRSRYRTEERGERTIVTSGRRIKPSVIHLPERVRAQLEPRDKASPVRAMVCVNPRGRPTGVRIADGTGVPEVDATVARELLADRFRPLLRRGQRVDFCERVTVVVSS